MNLTDAYESLQDTPLLALAQELYAQHPVGGHLHIVLDDGNLEGHHVAWCIARAVDAGEERQAAFGLRLLESKRARTALYRRYREYMHR